MLFELTSSVERNVGPVPALNSQNNSTILELEMIIYTATEKRKKDEQ